MNDIQKYKKGLAVYEKYCKVCKYTKCPSANGDFVKLTEKREYIQMGIFKNGRLSGKIKVESKPFCVGFIP